MPNLAALVHVGQLADILQRIAPEYPYISIFCGPKEQAKPKDVEAILGNFSSTAKQTSALVALKYIPWNTGTTKKIEGVIISISPPAGKDMHFEALVDIATRKVTEIRWTDGAPFAGEHLINRFLEEGFILVY